MPIDQLYLLAFGTLILAGAALALLADYLPDLRRARHRRAYLRGVAKRYGARSNRYKRERALASVHPRARYVRPL